MAYPTWYSAVFLLASSVGATVVAAGCGGDGGNGGPGDAVDANPNSDGANGPGVDAAPPPPPIACDEPGALPTPTGPTYYLSDCQTGAAAGCVPGDDANDGLTMATAKRTPDAIDFNALPAGTQVLFARGGAWTDVFIQLENLNVTADEPLFLDAYGEGDAPLLQASTGTLLEFGRFHNENEVVDDGGYVVRNLHLRGEGEANWGVWIRDHVHHIVLDSLEIDGFEIGIHAQSADGGGINNMAIRRNNIHHNAGMGMLSNFHDTVIECNNISYNNESGSGFNHGIYMGGGGANAVVRNNVLAENSVNGGRCTGGNITMHGVWNNVLFEGNTITQTQSELGCYGLSMTAGYLTPESMDNVVLRGNRLINLGCAICISAAPGIQVENNLIVNNTGGGQIGISVGENDPDDASSAGAVLRNNTIALTGSIGIALQGASGHQVTVVSNLITHAPGSTNPLCFGVPSPVGANTVIDYNLCDLGGGGAWAPGFDDLGDAQAAGFEANGLATAAGLLMTPAAGNDWNDALSGSSAAINAGHPSLSTTVDRTGTERSSPDIGAREYAP